MRTMSSTTDAFLVFKRLEFVRCLLGKEVTFIDEFCVGIRCDDRSEDSDLESTGVFVK